MNKFPNKPIPSDMAAGRTLLGPILLSSLLLTILMASPALALEPNQAVYIGGSATIAAGTLGTLDTTSPTKLMFRYNKPDGIPGQVSIPYATIKSASTRNEVTHHLGVAPAIAVGLLAARQRRYFLTLAWTDEEGFSQAAQIEISKRDQDPLLAVIHARMPTPCPRALVSCTAQPTVCAASRVDCRTAKP